MEAGSPLGGSGSQHGAIDHHHVRPPKIGGSRSYREGFDESQGQDTHSSRGLVPAKSDVELFQFRAWVWVIDYHSQSAKLAPAGSALREELRGVETSERPNT